MPSSVLSMASPRERSSAPRLNSEKTWSAASYAECTSEISGAGSKCSCNRTATSQDADKTELAPPLPEELATKNHLDAIATARIQPLETHAISKAAPPMTAASTRSDSVTSLSILRRGCFTFSRVQVRGVRNSLRSDIFYGKFEGIGRSCCFDMAAGKPNARRNWHRHHGPDAAKQRT